MGTQPEPIRMYSWTYNSNWGGYYHLTLTSGVWRYFGASCIIEYNIPGHYQDHTWRNAGDVHTVPDGLENFAISLASNYTTDIHGWRYIGPVGTDPNTVPSDDDAPP